MPSVSPIYCTHSSVFVSILNPVLNFESETLGDTTVIFEIITLVPLVSYPLYSSGTTLNHSSVDLKTLYGVKYSIFV